MSGKAPKVGNGPKTFVVQWMHEGRDVPDDIVVEYYEPTSAHYDEALRRVAMERLPDNEESMDRKLLEVCISKVGGEEANARFWADTPEPFRYLMMLEFRAANLKQFALLKNYLRRSAGPDTEPPRKEASG